VVAAARVRNRRRDGLGSIDLPGDFLAMLPPVEC
jgi:hypothetical protein